MAMVMATATVTAKKNSKDYDRVQVRLAPDYVFVKNCGRDHPAPQKSLAFHTKCDNIIIS